MNEIKKELISIIIPMYNAEKYIINCLSSIIKQTYKNYEVIIIDDESTDSSLMLCEKFRKLYENIKIVILKQKNSGPSKARNMGIKESKGKYIIFVDADDYLEENVLENMINNVEKDVLVKINYITFKEKYFNAPIRHYGYMDTNAFIKEIMNNRYHGSVWGSLFEKNIINNITFSEDIFFSEDTLFLIQYIKYLKKVKFVDGNYYYRIDNKNSITTSNIKIINNIISFTKALNKINLELDMVYNSELENKKVIQIEKEVAKVNDLDTLKQILEDANFQQIVGRIDSHIIVNKLYKILLILYKKRRIYILYLYIKLRKILKKIKNGK